MSQPLYFVSFAVLLLAGIVLLLLAGPPVVLLMQVAFQLLEVLSNAGTSRL